MKKVSGKIKLELAQFRELEAFMQFSQDLDPETKKRIETGQRMVAVLKQKNGAPMAFERQAVIMYAAINGHLAGVSVDNVPAFEESFFQFTEAEAPEIFTDIQAKRDIAPETEEKIKTMLKMFAETHQDLVAHSK